MGTTNFNGNQITINVNDTIPPENIATIDKGGLVGNTKSKEQLQVWQDELEEKVNKISTSAVKGEATPSSSPTPYNPTDYPKGLYEKWEVKTAGTYANFKDGATPPQPIVITTADLDKKLAYINVTNGVAKKDTIDIPGVIAKTLYDSADNVNPATMKATSERYDKTVSVLDFFLHPFEISDDISITMPRSGENKNAFINTSWQQYATPGSPIHNGVIDISELDVNMIEISIQGNQLDIAGAGILWLGLENTLTGAKVQLLKGSVTKGTYKFQIDKQAGYNKIYYSRVEADTTFVYKKVINLPVTTNSVQNYIKNTGVSQKVWNKNDNVNPAAMKTTSDRFDKALDVLNSFVYPKGETDWADLTADKIEYQGIIYNTGAYVENQPYGACGIIYAKDLEGVSSLRVIGPDMEKFGNTIAWWLGYKDENNFDVLRYGVVTSGSASIKTDPKYKFYRYSRPLAADAKIQRKMSVELQPEKDSVLNAIRSSGGGYSGVLDLSSVGVKESNTADQNTAIINAVIEEESTKLVQRIIMFPAGIFKVKEIQLARNTILGGAGKNNTGLVAETGTKRILSQVDGAVTSQEIFGLSFDGINCTEGVIYINNTFGLKIHNIAIATKAQYAIKLIACLYHEISDIYADGGDIQLHCITTLKMANNLNRYSRLYFVKGVKNCVHLQGGSNYVFNTCNFEDSGISGDETTGGVRMVDVSAGGEGVDVAFNNCWSEGVRGGYIYKFDNCKGNSVLRDCMLGKGGNGSGTIANAIVNINSNLLLSGATRFSGGSHFHPFPVNINNSGGSVLVDNPNINVGTNNVGTILKAQYS
ncbi:hypothetical protein [uncultured Chryseobacterium sp.]|uniref:hypothetical protein n=1 Tax=uncultured Chryseobacterium sp. TaxID=259322 RepID=UPI002582AE18|nr:hypothetical protein [uncultured Chryseobacterium sp.]